MPNENTPPPAADVTQNNAEVIAKLNSQGTDTSGANPAELQASGDALDALAAAVTAENTEQPAVVEDPAPESDAAPVVDEAAKAAADAAAAEKARVDAERAETLKKSEDYFKDSPALPPNASPKSSEAFSAIKIKAAQEIAARDAQLEEARKKLAEAEEKLKAGPDTEILRELEDHRQWRAKLDVEADPKFKEFDKQVASTQEFIYAQLKKSPAITDAIIESIKKHGGPEYVDMGKIFAAVKDPTLQRIVESKVADIEMAKHNKEQAIKEAKTNINQYVEQQRKAYQENVGKHNQVTQEHFTKLQAKLPWFAEKPVDAKADEPTRKAAEAHNAFVKEVKTQLDGALHDDSPEMRAVMLTGMAQLLYLQKVYVSTQAQFEATKTKLAEAEAKLAKFANASVNRLRETGAAPGGRNDTKPKGLDLSVHAGDALDNIAKQITEERARKANA